MGPPKIAGQLESYMVGELCPWPISIMCSGDYYWLLVCSGVLVCSGISTNRLKTYNNKSKECLYVASYIH